VGSGKTSSAFAKRDLSQVGYVYCWADGIHVSIRLGEDKLCLLVLIGVRADGSKELITLTDGYRESGESWADIEPAFATVRHRTKITTGPGSKAAGLAMAFKLIMAAQNRWRAVNARHLVALVRAGARFVNGKLRGQVQVGEPAAAGPGPVAGGPLIPVIGSNRVDPIAQRGTEPDQLARCRSSTRSWRTSSGAIHAPGSRSARSSCARIAAPALSFFSRAMAMALHRSGCTMCGSNAGLLSPSSYLSPGASRYRAEPGRGPGPHRVR
jgi:hypothetical protein